MFTHSPKAKALLAEFTEMIAQEKIGRYTPAKYSGDHLDDHFYELADEFFRISTSESAWVYFGFQYFIKPTLHFFGGEVVNRAVIKWLQWLLSEKRLAYYLHILQDVNWPDGKWAPAEPPLTPEQRTAQRERAMKLFDEVLGALKIVIPGEVLERGADHVLGCFENKQMNKHLYFVLLDLILPKLFPELLQPAPMEYVVERLAKQESAVEKANQDMAEYQALVQQEKEKEQQREKEKKRVEESLSELTSSVTQSFSSMSKPISQLGQALKMQKGPLFQKRDSEKSIISISTGSTLIF